MLCRKRLKDTRTRKEREKGKRKKKEKRQYRKEEQLRESIGSEGRKGEGGKVKRIHGSQGGKEEGRTKK